VADARTSGERAPAAIEGLVKQLLVTYKAVNLYPPSSTIPRENAREVVGTLRALLRERSAVRLVVAKEGLLFDGLPILPGQAAFVVFAREFYSRRLCDVRFHSGVTEHDIVSFLGILTEGPAEIDGAGGFESRLWDRQIDSITVSEVATKIIDAIVSDVAEQVEHMPVEGEKWPPDDARIDELLAMASALRPRDQRVLVRVMANPKFLSRYLQDAALARGPASAVSMLAERIATMARLANGELAEDRPALFRSVAEAIMALDGETRHKLLVDRLLADARIDDAVAEVIRQLDLEEICRALAEGLSPDPVSRDGISRALRNLALISMAAKDEVVDTARATFIGAGASAGEVGDLLEKALPTRLHIARKSDEHEESALDGILKLIDLAPSRDLAPDDDDEDLRLLRVEAHAGVTDGDVLMMLVTLTTLERRADVFGSLMALVEDNLVMLLEWGEFEIATDAASALSALARDESLDDAQRSRVEQAISTLAQPAQIRLIARTMRVFKSDSPEHATCRRLLGILGEHAIGPLLEVLADEPDMGARKALVDLVSDIAPGHVQRLGEKVTDPRWYFVRNVVSILGGTRGSDTLPYFGRTLRHPDARVRRETIRALSNVQDRLAEEMLVAALSDEDAQNVRLSARYLGTIAARGAATALIAVARGEGRGNREVGPRVEAIEALGRIGTPEARVALADLAGRRAIIRPGRAREIRAAAESAIAVLDGAGGGGAR
jgi:hypothetical protein